QGGAGEKDSSLASFRHAAKICTRLVQQSPHDANLRSSLAEFCLTTGTVLRTAGALAEALGLLELARQLYEGLVHEAPEVPRYTIRLSDTWYQLGNAQCNLGRHDEALAAYRQIGRASWM